MDEQFNFRKKYRNILLTVMAAALLITVISILISAYGASRIWANVLLNNQYFMGIALGGAFFVAVHRVALSGWHTVLQRLPDAMTTFLPVAFVLMLLIYFGMNHIYSWSNFEGHNEILEGKKAWLNIPFFFIRMIFYFTGWIALTWLMRRSSDSLMTSSDIKYHNQRRLFACLFLVFYAITVSTSSWDWIMSIDPLWFSTIFGWYVFISMFVTSLAFITLLIWLLKRLGYLREVREDHVHDLGILLFSFSIFWTYLWFAQYELIWYGHLPEETTYYITRLHDFKPLFFINLGINFIVPFFGLIRLRSKRQLDWVAVIAIILLAGHWLDYWLMIMPGAAGEKAGIGVLEVFMTIVYASVFIFIVLRSLAVGPLVVKNDPFIKESLTYES
ncbi:quinol:cytochrome C oxidoreductase [bacterium]|nr:MAG: quinol:cytochrome C oxidoreductase [bacterium]